jgi:hypothetical protein
MPGYCVRQQVPVPASLNTTVDQLLAIAVSVTTKLRRRPLLLTGGIAAIDIVLRTKSPRLPVAAILDESAHVATTLILLGPVQSPSCLAFPICAMVGSVIVDLDHVPAVLRHHPLRTAEDRPVTHSLPTLGLVYAMTTTTSAHPAWLGLSVGATSHFIRDIGTGGLPFLWPVRRDLFRVKPYVYTLLLATLACRTTAKRTRHDRIR